MRRALVNHLRERGVLTSPALARAFEEIPRERFLARFAAAEGLTAVYADEAIPTRRDADGQPISSSSQPAVMALMLELLDPGLNDRVLEIGLGTGYNAAILSRLTGSAGSVTAVDIDPEIVDEAAQALGPVAPGVSCVLGDGREGYRQHAPYDRIIATAAAAEIPRTWLDQLKEGGRLVTPLRIAADPGQPQLIPVFVREGEELVSVDHVWGGFMPLHGGDGGWADAGRAVEPGRAPPEILQLLKDTDFRHLTARLDVKVVAKRSRKHGLTLHFDWSAR